MNLAPLWCLWAAMLWWWQRRVQGITPESLLFFILYFLAFSRDSLWKHDLNDSSKVENKKQVQHQRVFGKIRWHHSLLHLLFFGNANFSILANLEKIFSVFGLVFLVFPLTCGWKHTYKLQCWSSNDAVLRIFWPYRHFHDCLTYEAPLMSSKVIKRS